MKVNGNINLPFGHARTFGNCNLASLTELLKRDCIKRNARYGFNFKHGFGPFRFFWV